MPARSRTTIADHPVLAGEWDAEANGDLGPATVSLSSSRQLAWRCERGHRWSASPIGDLVGARAMGVVHGPAGLGKTFAVAASLRRISGRRGAPAACWASFPSRPTMRLVAASLVEQLSGVPAGRRSRFALTGELLEELAGPERIVVIDEAQRLNTECIELLRHLHDHPQSAFALLLVGGDGAWQVLSREPMLRSRIYRRVAFAPLEPAQVLALMPGYHPLYAGVEPELLLLVDDRMGHGNLRNWAAFTRTAADLCRVHDRERIDEEIARGAFALHGGARARPG